LQQNRRKSVLRTILGKYLTWGPEVKRKECAEFIEGTDNPFAPWSNTSYKDKLEIRLKRMEDQINRMDEQYSQELDAVIDRLDKLDGDEVS
jgi:hypothetical protein